MSSSHNSVKAQESISRDLLLTAGDLHQFKIELFQELRIILHEPVNRVQSQWLRSSQVRKMLSISAGTLQTFRINGSIPYSKVGGIIFYKYEDVVKMLEGGK